MAVTHRLLVAIYHMLKHRRPYREIGARPQTEPAKRKLAERMQHRIERLGFTTMAWLWGSRRCWRRLLWGHYIRSALTRASLSRTYGSAEPSNSTHASSTSARARP